MKPEIQREDQYLLKFFKKLLNSIFSSFIQHLGIDYSKTGFNFEILKKPLFLDIIQNIH